MPLRSYKPTSPGLRQMTRSTFEEITTKEPYKPLLEPQKRGSGRNNQGRLSVRHRGGGEHSGLHESPTVQVNTLRRDLAGWV